MAVLDDSKSEAQTPSSLIGALLTRLRPLWIVLTILGVIFFVVGLLPASVEQVDRNARVSPELLIDQQGADDTPILATEVPRNRVADYSIEKFDYVSTQNGRKQWKLLAKRAFMFNREKLVHARTVTAHLLGMDDEVTIVTGKEAKYFMNERDLEVFGDVITRFPDGFEIRSEYLRYSPATRKIDIPVKYAVTGSGQKEKGQAIGFQSSGLRFAMADGLIHLLRDAVLIMNSAGPSTNSGSTKIQSDHCVINRNRQIAYFTMNPRRALKDRFVKIKQPTLDATSRRAELEYGDFAEMLQYMRLYEDVKIHERPTSEDGSVRYATAGRADFDSKRNVILLREFPQVYQDEDTVTGEVITVHRETDIVEVEHSNAYSSGI